MCTKAMQKALQIEMDAYDKLPLCLKQVFDQCPMKVSVYNTMRLPSVVKMQQDMDDKELAKALKRHLNKAAYLAHKKDLESCITPI